MYSDKFFLFIVVDMGLEVGISEFNYAVYHIHPLNL